MSSRKRKKKSKAAPAAKGGKKSVRTAAPSRSQGRNQPPRPRSGKASKAAEAVAVENSVELQESDNESEPVTGEHPAIDAAEAAPVVSEITELRPRTHAQEGSELATGQTDADDASTDTVAQPVLADGEAESEVEVEAPPPEAPATRAHLKRLIESLIFVSDQIITAQQIARIAKSKQAEVRELVKELSAEYEGRGIELVEVAGGYQFRSAAASAPFVRDLVSQRPVRLTRAQLETLALIAYRQPITRPEIDDVRGVDSGSAIKLLLERDLVKILGRKDEAGRPLLYGTAPYFLEFFSMKGMQDLPTLREFTELNEEHRELFQRKTGEIPDLSAEALTSLTEHSDDEEYGEEEEAFTGDGSAEQAAKPATEGEVMAEPSDTEPDAAAEDSSSDELDDTDVVLEDDLAAAAPRRPQIIDQEAPTAEYPRLSDMAEAADNAENVEDA